jgi:hypothetical protein
MGFFSITSLKGKREKENKIASYRYDLAMAVTRYLELYILQKIAKKKYSLRSNKDMFQLEEGIKIGKYEIGGTSLLNFLYDGERTIVERTVSGFQRADRNYIFWVYNSETKEMKTYSKCHSQAVILMYDEEKDEVFSYSDKAEDNLFVAIANIRHYYARNYDTLDGFKFIEIKKASYDFWDDLKKFDCNLKELHSTGTWSNQNEYNTMKKDMGKFKTKNKF